MYYYIYYNSCCLSLEAFIVTYTCNSMSMPRKEQSDVEFLHVMVLKSSSNINNWSNHLKANSSGRLVSTRLIRRTDIVGRDDPWLLYFKEGPAVRQNTTSSLLTVVKKQHFLSMVVPESQERLAEFWLCSQRWRERSKKNKVWSEGKRGSRWAVWDKIKQKILRCVCYLRGREQTKLEKKEREAIVDTEKTWGKREMRGNEVCLMYNHFYMPPFFWQNDLLLWQQHRPYVWI